MNLDTFLAVACFVGAIICYAVARYCEANVYLTFKEQKVGKRK
jgi:hypothetical protein